VGARTQSSRPIGSGHDNSSSSNDFLGELARRITQIERDAPGQFRGNSHPLALAGEEHLGLLQAKTKRFWNASHRYNCLRTIAQSCNHAARRAQDVEYDAHRRAKVVVLEC
jgi:hypothetical protein